MLIDPAEVVEVLACPKCKGVLVHVEGAFNCKACALSYPVRDGIPVLLIDEAVPLEVVRAKGARNRN